MSVIPFSRLPRAFLHALAASWRDGHHVALGLFRFLIPIVIAVKVLTEIGAIRYLALPLRPIMELAGLPAELGLSWAAAMLVNIYSGIIVFLGLLPDLPVLTTGQATTFALMVLVAHSLVLETRIAGQCGLSMPVQLGLRLLMAGLAGLVMHGLCSATGVLSAPAVIVLEAGPAPDGPVGWVWGEVLNLAKIYLLVWAVMLLQRGLDFLRVSDLLGRILHPVLRLLGISSRAAAVIIVGFGMGLIYGSGVIIKSAREGTLTPHDVFCSMTLMGIAHSLIEDTLLMALLGASLWGVLLVRLLLALAAGVIINRVYERLTTSARHTAGGRQAVGATRGASAAPAGPDDDAARTKCVDGHRPGGMLP